MMAAVKQAVESFRQEALPLVGVIGTRIPIPTFDTDRHILSYVNENHGKGIDGYQALKNLNQQRDFLLQTGHLDEEQTPRTVLSGWRLLLDKYAARPSTALEAALAVEDGAMHTHATAAPPSAAWWLEADHEDGPLEGAAACAAHLDAIADHIRRERPGAFRDPSTDLVPASAEELRAVGESLSVGMHFRQEPFEWVYDGLKPLLLPDVVRNRKGMSVSLATLTICVLRRLGLSAALHFVDRDGSGNKLPPDFVGQLANAPPATDIYVCGGTLEDPCILDPCVRKGSWVTNAHKVETIQWDGRTQWLAEDVIRLWAEHARTMVIASQRRGESDNVIMWMYQHAALDPLRATFPGL